MAKRREAWERLYDSIRAIRGQRYVCVPPATDADLDELESQLGSQLPQSYRQFMKRFGPGELQGWVALNSITAPRKRPRAIVAGRTAAAREYFPTRPEWHRNWEWLSGLVYFASSGGGDEYVWDPAGVTRKHPREYQFYQFRRGEEDEPIRAGDSFWRFVEWVDQDIRSWRDPSDLDETGPEIRFSPATLRAKKHPVRREVKRWLAWSDDTVLKLARTIRSEGRTEMFPILADALEEAGCTNGDVLESCRRGDPESDGAWVLGVLLGD